MNWLDIVLLLILVSSLVAGIIKGLIVSLFSFAGFALGLKLAGEHYSFIAGKLSFIPYAAIANVTGFVIIWAAAIVVAGLLGILVKKAVSKVGLGLLDHLGGLVFGLALGVFSCVLFLVVMLHFSFIDLSDVIQDSKVASFLISRLAFFFSLLPGDLGEVPLILPPGIRA